MDYKVSVIVPIYNVEKYIVRCAENLLGQTLDAVEYIFVNDCTPDNSIENLNKVIANFPKRKDDIKIIHHERNRGLAASRNTGLSIATGEYIYHCDSDDWASVDFCEKMYNKAKESNAEIVWCDFYEERHGRLSYVKQVFEENNVACVKSMLSCSMRWNVWNKIFKRSLFADNDIKEKEGCNLGEDLITIQLFYHAKRVAYQPEALYYYNTMNISSYTSPTMSLKRQNESFTNVKILETFLRAKKDFAVFDQYFHYLKMWIKLRIVSGNTNRQSLQAFCDIYSESLGRIKQHPHLDFKSRYLLFLANKKYINLIIIHNSLAKLLRTIKKNK